MNRSKYRRLTIVLLIPLLLAGIISVLISHQNRGYANFRCAPFLSQLDNCRSTGWDDFDKYVSKDAPAWFDVKVRPHESNSFPKANVSASQRFVFGAKILEVSPYDLTDESEGSPLAHLRAMSGQEITILFGDKDEGYRPLNPLGCNELIFKEDAPHTFTAGLCGIPDGVAMVKFSLNQQGQDKLMTLKKSIDDEIASYRKIMIMDYAFTTIIWLVLYFLISGALWLLWRAWKYVSAG